MIYFIIILAVIIALYFVITSQQVFGAEPKGKRLERMLQSEHYKNKQFQNLSFTPPFAEEYSMPKMMYDFFFKKKDPFLKPDHSVPAIHTDLKNIPKNNMKCICL